MDVILQKIDNTDYGMALGASQKREIDRLLDQLNAYGETQSPRPLVNPLVFGNYVVAYSSPGSNEEGEPAGGRFRSQIGRALFQTTGLFQSVLTPALVVNKVAFRILGLISGSISIRGGFREETAPSGKLPSPNKDVVKVFFEPPRINVGPASIEIGGYSSVVLATTYLDDRVRIGKGSRGSYFVFVRGGAAEHAQMDTVGTQPPSQLFKVLGAALVLGGLAYGLHLARLGAATGSVPGALGGAVLSLVCAGLAFVSFRGGLLGNADREVRRQLAEAEAAKASPSPTGGQQ